MNTNAYCFLCNKQTLLKHIRVKRPLDNDDFAVRHSTKTTSHPPTSAWRERKREREYINHTELFTTEMTACGKMHWSLLWSISPVNSIFTCCADLQTRLGNNGHTRPSRSSALMDSLERMTIFWSCTFVPFQSYRLCIVTTILMSAFASKWVQKTSCQMEAVSCTTMRTLVCCGNCMCDTRFIGHWAPIRNIQQLLVSLAWSRWLAKACQSASLFNWWVSISAAHSYVGGLSPGSDRFTSSGSYAGGLSPGSYDGGLSPDRLIWTRMMTRMMMHDSYVLLPWPSLAVVQLSLEVLTSKTTFLVSWYLLPLLSWYLLPLPLNPHTAALCYSPHRPDNHTSAWREST